MIRGDFLCSTLKLFLFSTLFNPCNDLSAPLTAKNTTHKHTGKSLFGWRDSYFSISQIVRTKN